MTPADQTHQISQNLDHVEGEQNALRDKRPEVNRVESADTVTSPSPPLDMIEWEFKSPGVAHPLSYPGQYASSGFDLMDILIRVRTRPSPRIDLGPIDFACALVLCDINQADLPIVYCSDAFELLTGYSRNEILGRNCRFLQAPDGNVPPGSRRLHVNEKDIYDLKRLIALNQEVQMMLVNYKKGGQRFINMLTTIPIRWDTDQIQYIVGFQAEQQTFVP